MQELEKVYYVVLVDGVPEAVSTLFSIADQKVKELGTVNRNAVIIPTISIDGARVEEIYPDLREHVTEYDEMVMDLFEGEEDTVP